MTSLLPLAAAVFSQLIVDFSLGRLWFALLAAGAAFVFLDETDTFGSRKMIRVTKLLTLVTLLSFVGLAVFHMRQPGFVRVSPALRAGPTDGLPIGPAPEPLQPLRYTDTKSHPVDQLIRSSEKSWMQTLGSQSQSLEAAVAEYRRRYQIPPPPHFDKWYAFAKERNVQLIDEYDTIYHSLLPFWALSPATIRGRVKEALGFEENNLIGLLIRDGTAAHVKNGQDWQQEATVGMMEKFVQYLPDMDLAFNIHDEPRVVVPHDALSKFIHTAKTVSMPAALENSALNNAFSPRPSDVNNGKRIAEAKTTRFNVFAHQPVWIPSRLSCSPDSPARVVLDDYSSYDNLTAYAIGDLGFVYNHTAFSDVCNSPSLSKTYGFFDRPNAFNVVHELIPIFSQSKLSSFQDIVYPSPWYWYGKVSYEEKRDMEWKEKEDKFWWRGSTTGGFSRNGGWRRQHRQHFVQKMNAPDQAKILSDANKDSASGPPDWQTRDVPRQDYKEIMDVHFSHIGQCDPGDCEAQKAFFDIVEPAHQQDAWKYKYLLDIDGNAFSGRFYAFLESHSLVFKMAMFREWHEEWIKPWVHYIPLSLRGEEGLEVVRYFAGEEEGKLQGPRMAEAGRDWARKALRNEDFEVWFFRLLLE